MFTPLPYKIKKMNSFLLNYEPQQWASSASPRPGSLRGLDYVFLKQGKVIHDDN